MSYASPAEIEAAIRDPAFSHARQGERIYRGQVLIYHHDSKSPSGVYLVTCGPAAMVDPLLRSIQRTSPLSPVEPR